MSTPLRVLVVEDRADDADLLLRELRRAGYAPEALRVETPEAMQAALDQPWDIVISDWSMPRFSAPAAFALLQERGIDLPFIIVSGTVGEETAVAAMKSGVHDFMIKGRLSRLAPAIERERRELAVRRQAREMRDQLVISERMASVGMLAAGLAHEINNPLAIAIANAEFVGDQLARLADELCRPGAAAAPGFSGRAAARLAEMRDCMAMAREAGERMRLVVRDLRIFSHPGDAADQGPTDLRAVLESALRMASTEIAGRARIVRDYAAVPPVAGTASRLGQVFLNLIVNAAQAIPADGAAGHEIGVALRPAGDGRVLAEVRDSGAGIPPDILPRIFEAFFTTKPPGIGTGLGLAICHRLVAALGGEIAVESAPGRGSAFRVLLPAAAPAAAGEPEAPPPPAGPPGMVLVVDDDPALRRTLQRILQREHEVTALGTAGEALALIAQGARFDLILCDLMMPQMSGMDLHAALRAAAPGQAARMAFVTGGAFGEAARDFLARVPNAVIEKPFTPQAMQQFVRRALYRDG